MIKSFRKILSPLLLPCPATARHRCLNESHERKSKALSTPWRHHTQDGMHYKNLPPLFFVILPSANPLTPLKIYFDSVLIPSWSNYWDAGEMRGAVERWLALNSTVSLLNRQMPAFNTVSCQRHKWP